jgi:3-oxoadipate enol-lactonase
LTTARHVDVDVGPCRLHVRDEGEGPPVLLVHSLTFDGDVWDHQAARLARRHRVLRVDLRGHGRTRWPDPGPVTLDDLAGDLAHLLDALGIERTGCAGLSIGGMVALRLALAQPHRVAALALLSTTAGAEDPERRALYEQVNEASRGREPDRATVDFVLSLMFSGAVRAARPDVVARFGDKLMAPPDPEGTYFVTRGMFARGDLHAALAHVACPTLVMASAADAAIPARHADALAAAIPGARLLRFAGSGHMITVERATEVTDALDDFFGAALGRTG